MPNSRRKAHKRGQVCLNDDMRYKIILGLVLVGLLAATQCQPAQPVKKELAANGYKHNYGELQSQGSYITATPNPVWRVLVHGFHECRLHPFDDSEVVSLVSDGMVVEVLPATWDGWTYIAVDKQHTWKCWIHLEFTEDDTWQ